MADEAPGADPVADAAARPKVEESADEEDTLLDRVRAMISLVVEQESNPNPRLIHAIAAICEGPGGQENDYFCKIVFCKFWSDTSYPVAVRCASARLLLSIQGALTGSAALNQLELDESTRPWDLVCKPAAELTIPSSPSCAQLNLEVMGAEIVQQDWVLMAKNLIRIAIYNISYIRGLFPEAYFIDEPVSKLGTMSKMLMPVDVDSRRLIDWVELGVYDALQKNYLETLLFCIHEKEEGPVIDEYAFTIRYPNSYGEEAAMKLSLTGNDDKIATFKLDKAEPVHSLIGRLIRTCVSFITNLDQMPKERTILIKLMYRDDVTPDDYEPPFFKCCAEDNDVQDLAKSFGRLCVISQRVPILLLDSGATHHICSDKSCMNDIRPIREEKQIELCMGDGKMIKAEERGWLEVENILLSQVAYVPDMKFNVVSIGYLDSQGLMVSIFSGQVLITDVSKSLVVGEGRRDKRNNDYVLKSMRWLKEDEQDDEEEKKEEDAEEEKEEDEEEEKKEEEEEEEEKKEEEEEEEKKEEEEEDEEEEVEEDNTGWILDSGCAAHIAGKFAMLRDPESFTFSFQTPQGRLTSSHKGRVTRAVELPEVLYCPSNTNNLLSVRILDDQGCRFTFYNGRCTIVCKDTLREVGNATLDYGNMLYYLDELDRIGKKTKRKRKKSRKY